MAGSAAGIARAREARMAKVAARRAAREAIQAANSPTVPNIVPTAPNDSPTGELLPASDCSLAQVSGNQTLDAMTMLQNGAPDAANTVVRVSSGRIRAPVAVRLQASLAILQGLGLLGVKPGAGGVDLEAAAGAVLAKLEGAMRFRDRRESAADAKILSSGRVLDAEKPDGSGS